MGLFDDQIKERKKYDNELFLESIADMADAIGSGRSSAALKSDKKVQKQAIEEILAYYKIKAGDIPDKVTNLQDQLEYLLRPNGIFRREIKLDKGWYKYATGPILGSYKSDGSIVAFIPSGFGGYTFYNVKSGRREKVNKNNENLFDSMALSFHAPLPLRAITTKDLMEYLLKQLSVYDIAITVFFMAMVTFVGLLLPRISELMYGKVLSYKSVPILLSLSVLLVCVYISQTFFSVNSSLIDARINTKLKNSIQCASMMRVMSLSPDFFKNYSSGELGSYLGNISVFVQMLVEGLGKAGLSSLLSLVYVFSIFHYARGLVIPALIMTAVTVAFSIISSFMQMKLANKIMKDEAKQSGLSYNLISGVQKIKLSGSEKRAFAKWAKSYSKEVELTYNPPLLIRINGAISFAITSLGTLIMYYYALQTGVSISDYFAFNVAYGLLSGAFMALSASALTIAGIKPVLDVIKPILDAEPEMSLDRHVITRLRGDIELNNISFRYNSDMPYVIDNLSLHIKQGSYVAIVGKTGCGKSTLVRLLLGFEKPLKGGIYYDKKDMNTLDLKSLRRNIGVVLQSGSLISGDIFSNITISAPNLSLAEAWEAAEIAGIAEDIKRMPMGMNTIISEGSGGISGGQKQRLMIARAVAHKPKILIFDEATSALDNITQKKVSEALDGMNCTRIVIAHRLSTIKNCDRIIYLEDGNIKEDGTYDELIAKNGYFADLINRQRIDNN